MSSEVYERIRRNPKFDQLVSRRSSFAWTLTAVVLGLYFIFIMIVAFSPMTLAAPIWTGGVASIAWPIGCLLYTSPRPRDRTRSRIPSYP